MIKQIELSVGLSGWPAAPWCAAFFPADLPFDWQLDYYANAYRCLGIDPQQADRRCPDWRDWLDELQVPLDVWLVGELASSAAPVSGLVGRIATPLGQPPAADGVLLLDRVRPLREVRELIDGQRDRLAGVGRPAVLLSGEAAVPSFADQLRQMIELMGL